MANRDFPAWLQEQMRLRDMSPADLARAMDVQVATVTRVLNEDRGVGKRVAKKIAKALKLDVDLVLFKAGITDRDPESPREALDPIALEILQMLENRTDAQKEAVRATVQALVEGFDRGLDGQGSGRGTGISAGTNKSRT